jgi:hypothetical protein
MITTTINSSISVKPLRALVIGIISQTAAAVNRETERG